MSQLKQFIRYGTAFDKEFLNNYKNSFDTLVISANSAVFQTESLSSFIHVEMKNKPFIIDPRLNFFQLNLNVIKKDGKLKESYKKLSKIYGFNHIIENDFPIEITDIKNIGIGKFVLENLNFQENYLEENLSTNLSAFSKYTSNIRTPEFLISPAFQITNENPLDWLSLNKTILDETLKLKRQFNNKQIYSNLLIDKEVLLNDKIMNDIIEIYSKADGLVFWINGFNELTIDIEYIEKYIEFITNFSKYNKKIVSLYGGYFSQLLFHFGITGVSHSLEYGETKQLKDTGGMPIHKYYLPEIKYRMKPFDITKLLKDMEINTKNKFYNEICNCRICKKNINSDNVDSKFFVYLYDEAKLQKQNSKSNCINHYLEVKYIENIHIEQTNIKELINEIEESYKKFIENNYFNKKELIYLDKWAKVLNKYV